MQFLTLRSLMQCRILKLKKIILLLFGAGSCAFIPLAVVAQQYNSNNCPQNFEYIDFGAWNESGEFTFSGRALPLGRFSKSGDKLDLIRYGCGKTQNEKLFKGGPQIVLVQAVEVFMPFTEIQKPAHVGARIRISRNQSLAKMPGTDAAYTRLFAGWLQMARETGDQAIEVGDGYTCMFDHDNPTLRGDAYYACSIDIVGMDRPGTYVSCKKFGGCELYFADNQGVIFDFEITSLKWNTRFSYAKSIPEAVKLWSGFALDFHKSFLGDTVYYESSVDAPKN